MRHLSTNHMICIFIAITGLSEDGAVSYLESEEWDIFDALASYRADQRSQA